METEIAQELLCPISHELCTDPVMADDGFVYERARIERWLASSRTSPLTRARMGPTLRAVPALQRIASLLVARGANLDVADVDGRTALMYAMENGEKRVVDILVKHGAQLDLADEVTNPRGHPTPASLEAVVVGAASVQDGR